MPIRLECLSHTPLHGYYDPAPAIVAEVERMQAAARARVEAFDPELVVVFAPDHYNGFFYDVMPPFCVGVAASAIGDFNSLAGPLDVPQDVALELAEAVMAQDLDVAVSYRMQVDHGCAQALEVLTGALDRYPVIPVFIASESVSPSGTDVGRGQPTKTARPIGTPTSSAAVAINEIRPRATTEPRRKAGCKELSANSPASWACNWACRARSTGSTRSAVPRASRTFPSVGRGRWMPRSNGPSKSLRTSAERGTRWLSIGRRASPPHRGRNGHRQHHTIGLPCPPAGRGRRRYRDRARGWRRRCHAAKKARHRRRSR